VIQKAPAFQFYPDDFLGSSTVGTADVDEIGAYTLLLCLDWQETGFEYDERRLARWCRVSPARFRKFWGHLGSKFPARDGRHFNPRLESERVKQAAFRQRQAHAAEVRWGSRGNAVALPGDMPRESPRAGNALPSPISLLQEQPSAQAAPAAGRSTWLTPVAEAWEARNGKGTFPFGQAAALLKSLRKAGNSSDVIARHLGFYLDMRGDERGHNKPPEQRGPSNWAPNLKSFRDTFAKWNPEASD
jgi:uncharacterized protein YdaU (DUF1376 family)